MTASRFRFSNAPSASAALALGRRNLSTHDGEEPVTDSQSLAEDAEEIRRSRVSRPGWERDKDKAGTWKKPGVAYVVQPMHEHKNWARTNPPYRVICPDGVVMGGAAYLSAAQRTAEVLGQPLPSTDPPDTTESEP